MPILLPIHVAGGLVGLAAGYTALFVVKGARTHRRAGTLFVGAMLVMALSGLVIAIVRDKAPAVNVPAGLLTAYLVVTALITVRPPDARRRTITVAALAVALGVAGTMLVLGVRTAASPTGRWHGMPPFPFFLFATIGTLGAVGDVRVLRAGARTGAPRLARHLWRMCAALAIAALSIAVRFPRFIPKPLYHPAMSVVPVLVVLAAMTYWLWRLRGRRRMRGIVVAPVVGRSLGMR